MKKRLKKLQASLAKNHLAAMLIRTNEGDNPNVLYMSGFGGTTGVLLITRKKAFIITDSRYYARATAEAPAFKLIKVERGKKITDYINQALAESKIKKTNKVGFEAMHVPVQIAKILTKGLNCKLTPTVHLVERFRQVKDPCEIELLRKACRITSRVFNEVVPIIKAGMTEMQVAFELDMRLRKYGAVSNSFTTIVASGPNSAMPHHATGTRKLKAGDPVVMDFGGLFPGGYCSDITRTIFVRGKKPHPKLAEIYNVVLGANIAARKALRPKMTWKAYDKVARDYITKHGFGQYFTHGLGHSLGLETHDPYDYEHDAFADGTVITDEPGIYIEGFGGVRIEDDLLVTTSGAERLTTAPYLKL